MAEKISYIPFETERDILNFKDIAYLPVDYEDIMELLIKRIQTRLPNKWKDFLESNFGMELMEAFTYEACLLIYLLNRNVNECFIPTARTKDAIYNMTKLIGYDPKSPQPSKGLVRFYLDSPHRNNIIIPKETKLRTNNGLYFYTSSDAILPAGFNYVDVDVVSGRLYTDTFYSTGTVGEKYVTTRDSVSFIEELKVDDIKFEQVDFLDILYPEGNIYRVEYDNDFRAMISFGTQRYGKTPNENSLIKVIYNVSEGLSSNARAYTINQIEDIIYDFNGNIARVNVANLNDTVGGDDEESPNEVRRNAPSVFRTQWRAVTKQDFRDLLRAERGIEKINVLDHYDNRDIGLYGVKILIVPSGGGTPTKGFSNYLRNILEDRRLLTTNIDFLRPSYVPVDLNITVKVDKNYNSANVLQVLRNKLSSYLSWKNRDFGANVSAVDIYRVVDSVEGVVYADNLSVSERKFLYLNEDYIYEDMLELQEENTNEEIDYTKRLNIIDTLGVLRQGTPIVFINPDGQIIGNNLITEMDGSIFTFAGVIDNDIFKGSSIYPVFHISKAPEDLEKLLYIDDVVTDLSNVSIRVIDQNTGKLKKEYMSYYRNEEGALYIGEFVDKDIEVGDIVYVIERNEMVKPINEHIKGMDNITLKYPPRFSIGASLTIKDDPSITYFVRSIFENKVFITPNLQQDINEETLFNVKSDSLFIYNHEIADVGNIIINLLT